MRLSTDKNTFLNALEVAKKAVTGRATMDILSCLLLKVNNGTVSITGSDLDLTILSSFKVLDYENGAAAVDAKLLYEYVKKLKNGKVVVSTDEKSLLVKSGRSHSTMVTMPTKDYPNLKNSASEVTQLSFVSSELRDGIKEVIYSTSQEETRPILTGVLFEVKNDSLNLVALDGYRLCVRTISVDSNKNISAVIPGKSLKEVLKLLPKNSDTNNDKDIDIQLNISNNFAEFIIGDISISTRLLEGDFIKYSSIIPQDFTTKIVVDKEELESVIGRTAIMDSNKNLIKMEISQEKIIVSSNSSLGTSEDEVAVKNFEGKELTIAFNSKFWIEMLAALSIEDEQIECSFGSNINPVVIRKNEDNKFTGLVLPVRLMGISKTAA